MRGHTRRAVQHSDAWDAVPETVLGSREGRTGSRGPRDPGGGPGGGDREARGGLVTGRGIREEKEVAGEEETVVGGGCTIGSPVSRSTSTVCVVTTVRFTIRVTLPCSSRVSTSSTLGSATENPCSFVSFGSVTIRFCVTRLIWTLP